MKIALVPHMSQASTTLIIDDISEQWGTGEWSHAESLEECGQTPLFGKISSYVVTAENNANFVKNAQRLSPSDIERLGSCGVVILCEKPTKAMKELVKSWGGVVADPLDAHHLLSRINVTPAVRQFLSDYVGDDEDMLVPVVCSLSTIPSTLHPRITIEDMWIRFPGSKGSLPPWNVSNDIFLGNVDSAIDTFRRVTRNQTRNCFAVARITTDKIRHMFEIQHLFTDEAKRDITGCSKGALWHLTKEATHLGYRSIVTMLKVAANWETGLKTVVDPLILSEQKIVELCDLVIR